MKNNCSIVSLNDISKIFFSFRGKANECHRHIRELYIHSICKTKDKIINVSCSAVVSYWIYECVSGKSLAKAIRGVSCHTAQFWGQNLSPEVHSKEVCQGKAMQDKQKHPRKEKSSSMFPSCLGKVSETTGKVYHRAAIHLSNKGFNTWKEMPATHKYKSSRKMVYEKKNWNSKW